MDDIHNPSHYCERGTVQPIEFITSAWPDTLRGNCAKYVARYPYKGAPIKDLQKAHQYLAWAIQHQLEPRPLMSVYEYLSNTVYDGIEASVLEHLYNGQLLAAEQAMRELIKREIQRQGN